MVETGNAVCVTDHIDCPWVALVLARVPGQNVSGDPVPELTMPLVLALLRTPVGVVPVQDHPLVL